MRDRCNNSNSTQYADYGGRGIRVCSRWDNFAVFAADMGPRPEGATLEREDNDRDYEPGNCRWATRLDQTLNRRSTIWVVHDGKRMCLKHAAQRIGVDPKTLKSRLAAEGIL